MTLNGRAVKLAQGIMPYLEPGEEFALVVVTPSGGPEPDIEFVATNASHYMAQIMQMSAATLYDGDYVVQDMLPGLGLS